MWRGDLASPAGDRSAGKGGGAVAKGLLTGEEVRGRAPHNFGWPGKVVLDYASNESHSFGNPNICSQKDRNNVVIQERSHFTSVRKPDKENAPPVKTSNPVHLINAPSPKPTDLYHSTKVLILLQYFLFSCGCFPKFLQQLLEDKRMSQFRTSSDTQLDCIHKYKYILLLVNEL